MDALHAARRWADAWARAWRTHNAELVGSLYVDGASFRSQPFRELDDPAGYARWAFGEEAEAQCRFAEPASSGHDGAGVALLRFGADGRVVAERDYWNLAEGRVEPYEGWGPLRP